MRKVLFSCVALSLLFTSSLLAKGKQSPCGTILKSLSQIAAAQSVDKLSKHITDPVWLGQAPIEPTKETKKDATTRLGNKEDWLHGVFFERLAVSIKGKTLRTTYDSKGDPSSHVPIQKGSCVFEEEEDFSIYIKPSAKDWIIYGVLSY